MGGIYFCVMTAELTALKTVETSTVSFVTNTAVVIVPLIQAALSRRWPERRVLFGALACLLGVALLTLRGGLTLAPGVGYWPSPGVGWAWASRTSSMRMSPAG